MTEPSSTPSPLYCYNHPKTETVLRCNRCERPICIKCAVSTPTGYRCKECVRGQQKVYETAQPLDYVIAFFSALILSYLGSRVAIVMGFFTLFIAPLAGVIIAEAIRMLVRRRRSRLLYLVAAISACLGSLPYLLLSVSGLLLGGLSGGSLYALLPLAYRALYTFLVTTTVYYRLSGIQL